MRCPSDEESGDAEERDDQDDDEPTPSEAEQTAQYCRALADWTGSDEDRSTLDEIAEILHCEEVVVGPPITVREMLDEAREMLPKGRTASPAALEYLRSVLVEQLGPEWMTELHGAAFHVDVRGPDVALLGIFPKRLESRLDVDRPAGAIQVQASLSRGFDEALEEMMIKLARRDTDTEWGRLLREYREWRKDRP